MEQQISSDLAQFVDSLEHFLNPPILNSGPIGYRRWQTHPINQLRLEQGFYNNLVKELKDYFKNNITTSFHSEVFFFCSPAQFNFSVTSSQTRSQMLL